MASVVDICNMALSHIRAGRISSINDATLQGQQCRLFYGICRDQLIRDGNWQFARALRPLTLLDGVKVFNWRFAYQYPTDILKLNRLVINFEYIEEFSQGVTPRELLYGDRIDRVYPLRANLRAQVEHEIHNNGFTKMIVCNEPDLRADVILRVEDTNLFDPQVTLALSHLLASYLSTPIVGGEAGLQYKQANLGMYSSYIAAALANDNNEQYHAAPESDFITERF